MLLQFCGENKRYGLFDIAYFFCHGDDTAITHAHTIVFIVYLLSTSTSQMFCAGTECLRAATALERSSICIRYYFLRTKLLHFETRSVCAYAARTQCFSNSLFTFVYILSCPCTECKNVALGGVDTSFFSLFSTKKHAFFAVFWLFLHFFDLYCTFLRRRDRRERAQGTF